MSIRHTEQQWTEAEATLYQIYRSQKHGQLRCSKLLLLDEGALADGDWGSHLVLPHLDSNHCQQALGCDVSLLWPASSHACCMTPHK